MRHFEFWNPRLFEGPYYARLAYLCAINKLSIRFLAKANYALDHGEIGIGSKLATQLAFEQTHFLPAELLPANASPAQKKALIQAFVQRYNYPVVLKPDMGAVGKGVTRVGSDAELGLATANLSADTMVQQYTPFNVEYGVFFVRHSGQSRITGINKKHFPIVVGDSKRSLLELAQAHDRYTDHWNLFLKDLDTSHVPGAGEQVQLSFIGSHTMGCKFTNDSHLLSEHIEATVFEIADSQPGFNFGRLDVKASSEAAFLAGEFVVIEVNGAASLPTHMFDPANSLREGYRIFFEHADHLVQAAVEQRGQEMPLMSYRSLLRRVVQQQRTLEKAHQAQLG